MSRSSKTMSPSKENLLVQHLAKLERSHASIDDKKYGSQCSINLDENFIDLPTEPKRRRLMPDDTPSSVGSLVGSQVSSRSHSPSLSECFLDDSLVSTPSVSPAGTLKEHFRRKYKKDELWAAIETNYKYLMDKGIIEACQTTESEGESSVATPNVSFGEFLQQYKEICDWLMNIQAATQQKRATSLALSEKYLNHSYHEEIQRSPRLETLNEYAMHLKCRHPLLRDEVDVFLAQVRTQWDTVKAAVAPSHANSDPLSMLRDLEDDLACLRKWLDGVEEHLRMQTSRDWAFEELEFTLSEHKILQREIESHSRIVSAILKLSERLQQDRDEFNCTLDHDTLEVSAHNLERRWHGIWLQSLEWQCRLEDAIGRRKGILNTGPYLDPRDFANLREYTDDEYDTHDVTSSGEDSFNGLVSYRGDYIQQSSPLLDDLNSSLSLDCDKNSSKDSALASETEQKTFSDMSENYQDLSFSAGSDSDREFLRQIKIKKHDSRDIGYGSESQSDELETRYRGITFSGINGRMRKTSTKSGGDFYATVAVDTSSSTDKSEGGNSNNAEQTTCDEADINAQIQQVLQQEEPEMEDIRYLIDQADIMVQQGNTFNKQFSPKRNVEGQKSASAAEMEQHPDGSQKSLSSSSSSGPGRDMVDKGVGTIESSCDASDEESGDSDAPGEDFSMVTDDGTETIDSVMGSEYTSDEMRNGNKDYTKLPKLYDTNTLRRRVGVGRKERPWSVIELPNVTELKLLSTSESAIDKLGGTHSDSDIPSTSCTLSQSPTFPRRVRRVQRAIARDSNLNIRSQLGAKRKLDLDTSLSPSVASAISETAVCSSPVVEPVNKPETIVTVVNTSNVENSVNMDDTIKSEQTTEMAATNSERLPSGNTSQVPYVECACTSDEELLTPMMQELQNARFKSSGSSFDDSDTQGDNAARSEVDDPTNDGSFSENAWDNYQAPLYATGSEDPPEEALTWEPGEMEFDDEFSLPQSTILATLLARRSEDESYNTQPKLPPAKQSTFDDSDSDIEDLHHVLAESRMQLKVADRSLKKKRKDPLKTGLYLNPGKYGELMATIETNLRCLEAINQHLDPDDVSAGDMRTIQDLLYQWEKLHAFASDRRNQSQEVKTMYATLLSVDGIVSEGVAQLERSRFKSQQDLQATILALQDKQKLFECQQQMLTDLRVAVATFSTHNPSVNMECFLSQIRDTEEKLEKLQHRCVTRLGELERITCVWHEYLETRRELEVLLTQERELIERLAFSQEMEIEGYKTGVETDLKTLVGSLALYEEKLIALQRLRGELLEVSDDDAQLDLTAGLADIRNQLYAAQKQANEIMMAKARAAEMKHSPMDEDAGMMVEEKMEVDDVIDLKVAPPVADIIQPKTEDCLRERQKKKSAPIKKKTKSQVKPKAQGSSLDWLKWFPVQAIALAVLLGLMYLYAPDTFSRLLGFTLRLTPEVKYVNGAPPL